MPDKAAHKLQHWPRFCHNFITKLTIFLQLSTKFWRIVSPDDQFWYSLRPGGTSLFPSRHRDTTDCQMFSPDIRSCGSGGRLCLGSLRPACMAKRYPSFHTVPPLQLIFSSVSVAMWESVLLLQPANASPHVLIPSFLHYGVLSLVHPAYWGYYLYENFG